MTKSSTGSGGNCACCVYRRTGSVHATRYSGLDAGCHPTTWTQDLREERKWQERRPDSLLCDSFAAPGNFSSTQVDTMVLAET